MVSGLPNTYLGGGLKYLLFGEIIQFDEHIFQMGWFNHQPAINKDFLLFFEDFG